MKLTIKILFVITVFTYSFLFFEQGFGINYLIFSIILTMVIGFIYFKATKLLLWKIMAFIATASSFNVAFNHSYVALITNILSLFILIGLSIDNCSSFLTSGLQTIYSIVYAPILKFINYFGSSTDVSKTKNSFRLTIYIIPFAITFIFFLLYIGGNSIFSSFVSQINLNFISWLGIFFTLGGFLLLFGIFFPNVSQELILFYKSKTETLFRRKSNNKNFKSLGLKTEFLAGKLLLILLNILLLIVNFLDVIYLYIIKILPGGVNPSVVVHEGINTLILSIILAIAIILYLFRGNLNFFKANKTLKTLTFIWIVQNILMIINISFKNHFYVLEQGLTFKRIGVFVYLLLTLIGLITTFYKVNHVKSNWYLIKINSFLFFIVLFTSSFFNWTSIITNYNLTHATRAQIDFDYLIDLSDSNIPQLQSLLNNNNINPKKKRYIIEKTDHFYYNYLDKEWKSWNYDDYRINQFLKEQKNKF